MFFSVYHNQSGEEWIRPLAPNEKLDCRALVRRWADREFDFEVAPSFSEPGAHIQNGCADYQAEIRSTKASGAVCWDSEPFYLEASED